MKKKVALAVGAVLVVGGLGDCWYTGNTFDRILAEQIAHFFKHYKDLEKGKSVEIVRWADPEETGELIRQGIERAKAAGKGQP